MKLTEFSLRYPLVVFGITVAICIFGVLAYSSMGVAITPNVNFPSVVVTTVYPGADPETIETNVSRPLEDAIATLPNIDTNGLTSISSQGVSVVIVQFSPAANADLVSVDVERVVSAARNKLPAEAESPTITKLDINAFGVATVVLSGPQTLSELQDVAENVVQKAFNALPGVGSTTIRSGITREIHVVVDDTRLWGRGLSINNVVNALQTQQLEVPAGNITRGTLDHSVYFDSLVTAPQQLGNIILLQTPSGAVYLRDVAAIEDTIKKRETLVRANGQDGLALVVVKLPEANTIGVVNEVNATIAQLQPRLPPGARLDVVVDASTYTAKSFNTVQRALFEAVIWTGLILLLFLHTWRSTAIVLVSIPTSLLVTFIVMRALNYNLNLLTMMALTLSIGILVDDSIVVLENIFRHLKMGKTPYTAALDGRSEIGTAAITITLVDVVVYVPIAILISGISAQFIRPFALAIAAATLASLVVSFTLTPLLAYRFLKLNEGSTSLLARFGRGWDRGFGFLEESYRRLLAYTLPRRGRVIAVGVGSFLLGVALWAFGFIGTDFFPSGDQSEIDLTISMPPSTTLDVTNEVALETERILNSYHEVRGLYSVVGFASGAGFSADAGSNQVQIAALLVPPHARRQTSAELGAELRELLSWRFPTAKIRIGLPNAFGFGGFGGQPIQVQVQGGDPETLNGAAAEVERAVRAVPGAVSVRSSNENLQNQIRVKFDWARAADLGVSAQSAGVGLRTAIDGFKSNSSQYRQVGRSAVDIRVLSRQADTSNPESLARLPVSSGSGVVRLDQIATFQQTEIPTSIRHINRLRAVTIGTEPGEGRLVGDIQGAVVRAVRAVQLPPGVSVTFTGQGQQGSSAFGEIFQALFVAVVMMYMLMMMLFGSLTLPLAVLMSLPLAVVGAFGAMALTNTPFTLFSLLGFAVLVGLVGKNAILLVDYTEILRGRGYTRSAALLEAGPTRLRPIIMTTLSIMAALMPIATGLEEGSELLKSAAVVLFGGLITSTLLTLVFVPAMFTVFDDIQHWFGGRGWRRWRGRRARSVRVLASGELKRSPAPAGNGRAAKPPVPAGSGWRARLDSLKLPWQPSRRSELGQEPERVVGSDGTA